MKKLRLFFIASTVGLVAAFLAPTAALADDWLYFTTPAKYVSTYSLTGTDDEAPLPDGSYCPSLNGDEGQGCWEVQGTSNANTDPSIYDTQEVGEDRCSNTSLAPWKNGPNTGHSNTDITGAEPGTIWYNCIAFPNSDHQYCLKSYHKALWGSSCNPATNCILLNSWVFPVAPNSSDSLSNPGC